MVNNFFINSSTFILFLLSFILFFSYYIVFFSNPIYSLLSLIMVFVFTSVLFIYIGADFLAFIYIIIYLGAVLVLFLWAIMTMPTVGNTFSNYNFYLLSVLLFNFFFFLTINEIGNNIILEYFFISPDSEIFNSYVKLLCRGTFLNIYDLTNDVLTDDKLVIYDSLLYRAFIVFRSMDTIIFGELYQDDFFARLLFFIYANIHRPKIHDLFELELLRSNFETYLKDININNFNFFSINHIICDVNLNYLILSPVSEEPFIFFEDFRSFHFFRIHFAEKYIFLNSKKLHHFYALVTDGSYNPNKFFLVDWLSVYYNTDFNWLFKIGFILYNHCGICVILVGYLLLISMVGSIFLLKPSRQFFFYDNINSANQKTQSTKDKMDAI
jgi:NADH:ubiquinone oxidoreductase subunit 6 (subunit J)